jgi:hypothetical protein
MGQMATFTPAMKVSRIIRRQKVTMDDLKKIGHVKLFPRNDPKGVQGKIIYTKLGTFSRDELNCKVDILWRASFHFSKPCPLWSGCMQLLHSHIPHPGKSSKIFLPVVDLTPSDPTCVRSMLEYISDHSRRHHATPIITLDQQLWWIAYMIIESQPAESILKEIVLILGGFHTEMSFLGTIGSLMAGSGLKEIMSQVYAEGSVNHMLSGKSVARAVRAHFLIESALNTIAISSMYNIPVPRIMVEPEDNDLCGTEAEPMDTTRNDEERTEMSSVSSQDVAEEGIIFMLFYASRSNDRGNIVFVLFVCLSTSLTFRHNFEKHEGILMINTQSGHVRSRLI